MKVRVIVSVPGFAPTSRFSTAGNFTFTGSGPFTISGTPEPGRVLQGIDGMEFEDPSGNPQFPSRSYRWLVNGVAAGPFGSPVPFNVENSHVGKKIVLQSLIENFGIAPQMIVTAPVTVVLPPIAPMFEAYVNKTVNPDPAHTFSLSVSFTASPPVATGPTYQWYRQVYPSGAITAISGKTASTYSPTAADYNYRIFVRATWTKPGFRPLVIESFHKDYSLRVDFREVSPTLQVGGTAGAGYYVNYEDPAATNDTRIGTPPFTTKSFKWLRSGVVIPGAVGESYGIVSADLGKKLAFLVSASNTLGYLPAVNLPSNSSLPVTAGALSLLGVAEPTFTVSPTLRLTVTPGAGNTNPVGGTVTKYQWYRAGVLIPGAITNSIQLTAADAGKELNAILTYSKPGFANAGYGAAGARFFVQPSTVLPVIVGLPIVQTPSDHLTVGARSYIDAQTGAPITPTVTYQWFRSGVAIPLATGPEYSLTAADRGKTITVRTTAKSAGLLDSVSTSLPTAVVGDLMLENWDAQPNVTITKEGTPNAPILRVGPTATGITGPVGLVRTYQWFRGGVAVAGATKVTYAITALDRQKDVYVRVTTTHAPISGQTFASNTKTSIPFDHTIRATTAVSGLATVGNDLTLTYSLATGAGPLTVGFVPTYQWLRNGLVIPGATSNYYSLAAADVGKRISVRATFAFSGFLL